jgi:hypothetical protein
MRAFLGAVWATLIVTSSALADAYTYDLPAGWSMISLPLEVPDHSVATLFPSATSVFEFVPASGSGPAVALEHGNGYWTNLSVGGAVDIGAASATGEVEIIGRVEE